MSDYMKSKYNMTRDDNVFFANKELIRTGQGIISIPVEKIAEYLGDLINYYELNDNSKLKN